MFEALAGTAEAVAETAEYSAAVHDAAGSSLDGAGEHAVRDRRFADAERAAAAAYRSGQVPSAEIRQVIRDSRSPADSCHEDQADADRP
jgi:hypothetical protein